MKHYVAAKGLVAILFAIPVFLGMTTSAQAEPTCSLVTLHGSYGYTNTGASVAGPDAGPFSGVGRQTFDGKGNTQASATVSVNGNVLRVTIKGTYLVNADCTGSMTLVVSAGNETLTSHVDFVVLRGGAKIRAINTDSGSVITTIAEKQFGED